MAMTDSEAEGYLRRLEGGDREALAPLIPYSYPAIRRSVRDRVAPDFVSDCAQATFLNFWKAVQDGRFRYQGIPQFFAFITTIARREARRYYRREEQYPAPLGEDREFDAPEPAPSAEAVEMPILLNDLLDKALIDSARGAAARDLGLLKKMAFQSFYVDRLSQREIVGQLGRHATLLNVKLTEDTLNNWLSGGRILKTVVGYLLAHPDAALSGLIRRVAPAASMSEAEREVLLLHWRQGRDIAAIAAERGTAVDEVRNLLDSAIGALRKAIEKRLHQSRLTGT